MAHRGDVKGNGLSARARLRVMLLPACILGLLLSLPDSEAQPLFRPAMPASLDPFLQQAQNTCALGALAYALVLLGDAEVTQEQLQGILSIRYPHRGGVPPKAGYSLSDVAFALESRGVAATVGTVASGALEQLRPPVLLRLMQPGMPHFVVLAGWRKRDAVIFDPAMGELTVPRERLLARWLQPDNTGIIVTPTG